MKLESITSMDYTTVSNTITWNNPVIKQEIKQEPQDATTTKPPGYPFYEDRRPGFIKQERNSFDSNFYSDKKPDIANIRQEPISSSRNIVSYCDTSIVKHEVDIYPVKEEPTELVPQKIDSSFISWSNTPVFKIKEESREDVQTGYGFTTIQQEWGGNKSDDEIEILHVKIEPGRQIFSYGAIFSFGSLDIKIVSKF